MENKIKIKLNTTDEMIKFVSITNKFKDDVMLYYESQIIDGKSCDDIAAFGLGKVVLVELLSPDIDALYDFEVAIKQFTKDVD